MARLTGPKGQEVRETCDEFVINYVDDILALLESDDKNYRWWYLDTISERFKALCYKIGYTLDVNDPRF